ncbi:MAG: nucleotide exchange factor GrpE [Spirochaetes bacterium]|nr:MAG: nucleotide exchange factor GrpE [Thermodesulfobacteriota bacterium]RKX92992.1 MAG: nucleotide exchange factor GrpE [Spirochaetota bacterium]
MPDKSLLELIAKQNKPEIWNIEDKGRKLEVISNDLIESIYIKNKFEITDILIKLIEIADSFERLFQNIKEKTRNGTKIDKQTKIWLGNFENIEKRVYRTLKDLEVIPIRASERGKPDPGLHEIVGTKEVQDFPEGHIIEEVQKGYCWRGQELRPSKVITAKKKGG